MAGSESVARPGPGQGVNVVVLGDEVAVLGGRVLFDRGRGLVVETAEVPAAGWNKGRRVILIFSAGEKVYRLQTLVAESLSARRCYLLPSGVPSEMEKREYIRAIVTLPAALEPWPGAAGRPPLVPTTVELSASGFRWFGPSDVVAGGRVRLSVAIGAGEDPLIQVPAEVIRVDRMVEPVEVAGRFMGIDPDARDTVLRIVFQTRQHEFGLDDEPTP